MRPVFLERQPRAQRHADMLATLTRPVLDPVTGNLIRAWLLKKYNAMLVDFLDALGLPHKEGVVEDLPKSMDDPSSRRRLINCWASIQTKWWRSTSMPSAR